MKVIARIFLIVFIVFLSAPTIVLLIKKSSHTTKYFSMSEEEQVQKEVKDLAFFVSYQLPFQLKRAIKSGLILSENLSRHDNVSKSIFTPPPDLV